MGITRIVVSPDCDTSADMALKEGAKVQWRNEYYAGSDALTPVVFSLLMCQTVALAEQCVNVGTRHHLQADWLPSNDKLCEFRVIDVYRREGNKFKAN